MKNKFLNITMLFAMVVSIVSCSKMEIEEESSQDNKPANSTLTVRATANASSDTSGSQTDSEDAEISYPVNIYVFSVDEDSQTKETLLKCKSVSTINNADEAVSFELSEGSYKVYAVGGADSEKYTLPTKEDATPESIIALNDKNNHGDLMTASNTITLKENEENTLTLAMTRKIMRIQTITMKNIPKDVTAVSLSIMPLHTGVRLNGEYAGENGSQTINLIKGEADKTWINDESVNMLTTSGEATITVSLTNESGTKSYSYTSSDELLANYKINITGTYKDKIVQVSGTITGAKWEGTKEIVFKNADFDSGETTDETEKDKIDDGEVINTEAPAVGTAYKGYYVLKSEISNGKTVVTLMSAEGDSSWTFTKGNETELKAEIDRKLASLNNGEITGWRLPTSEEIRYLYQNADDINTKIRSIEGIILFESTNFHLFIDGTEIYSMKIWSDSTERTLSYTEIGNGTSTVLRALTTITFTN